MTTFKGHSNIHRPTGTTDDSWFPFTCGHCGREVSGAVIAWTAEGGLAQWLQCPVCGAGSVRNSTGAISPGIAFGPMIQGLPAEVAEAYDEARRCMSVGAYTATELVCRKILMHVAVDKGAKEGETFVQYLAFLEKAGFVTPTMKHWVALIKSHGNEATHKLPPASQDRAEGTLMLTAELLRLTYEMDHLAARYAPPPPASP